MSTPARIAGTLCLAAGVFIAGYMANRHVGSAAASASTRQALYYTCPMHPQYRSDHPGDAPCCGMRMAPVYADAASEQSTAVSTAALQVSAEQRQLIGVRTEEAKVASASHVLRLPGRIAVDEGRLYRVVAATDGWVRELGSNSAGIFVKKDEKLASYYAQNLLAAVQTLIFALQTNAQEGGEVKLGYQRAPTKLNLQVAIDSLRGLGMSDIQIEEMRKTGAAPTEIGIFSPVAGFVIARNISPGQRFDKGLEIYRIADISHVWLTADIFEKDRELLKRGATAKFEYQGRSYTARLSDALPQLDPQSRTLKTRFEVDNPGNVLQPDMFVELQLPLEMPAALTVPADAVIEGGVRQTVFVERRDGMFEPRTVETGWRIGGRVQIVSGLEEGDRVVVSGNFLIDSESRIRLAAAGALPMAAMAATNKDPVCGMDVDPKTPDAIKTQHGGKTYYFCSNHCKKEFEAHPEKYVPKKMAARDANGARGSA